jgi:hypothetical protein
MLVPDNIRQNIQGLFAPEENHAKFSEGRLKCQKGNHKKRHIYLSGKGG